MDTRKLTKEQAVEFLSVVGTPMEDKNEMPYHRARFEGKGFIVRPDFYADWKKGDIGSVVLEATEREVTDSEGKTTTVQGWNYVSHTTGTQLVGLKSTDLQLKRMERELLATAPKVADLKELVG